MSCSINNGWTVGCRDSIGGLNNLYILSGSISTVTEANGAISDIDGTGVFYKFELVKQTADFTETPTPNNEAGTVFYSQVVNAAFMKMQASLRNQVKTLAASNDLKLIIETNNGLADGVGQYFLIGQNRGAVLTGGAGTSGTAFGDSNQYALNFEALELYPASEITTTGGDLSTALTNITIG